MEFDHFLAERLHMTVEEMRRRMSGQEWLEWSIYYQRKAQRQEAESHKARR